jgi:hypothetical protein
MSSNSNKKGINSSKKPQHGTISEFSTLYQPKKMLTTKKLTKKQILQNNLEIAKKKAEICQKALDLIEEAETLSKGAHLDKSLCSDGSLDSDDSLI